MFTTLAQRFWSKVNKNGPVLHRELGPCWVWTGCQDGRGRGAIWVETEKTKAPRVAWYLETGKWPNPNALHKCDNGLCVRFSHLFEGTQKDNMMDAALKGRIKNGDTRGEGNGRAKLTELQVKHIKYLLQNGASGREIAELHGVSKYTISLIKLGKHWKHVTI